MKQRPFSIDLSAKAIPVLLALVLFVISITAFPASALALPIHSPIFAMGSLFSLKGNRPTNLGVTDGLLAPCPTSPNCVSSQSTDSKHQIDPLSYDGTAPEAWQRLKSIMAELPRTKIIAATDDYLYVEFSSALMGFVDDVEFYLNPAENLIQVRSASRLGESDLGVNRKRIEAIRKKLGES